MQNPPQRRQWLPPAGDVLPSSMATPCIVPLPLIGFTVLRATTRRHHSPPALAVPKFEGLRSGGDGFRLPHEFTQISMPSMDRRTHKLIICWCQQFRTQFHVPQSSQKPILGRIPSTFFFAGKRILSTCTDRLYSSGRLGSVVHHLASQAITHS